jgi:2-polyprenyl-3-methyl-5-hydroxy-6-metoxy-1,4-benzoquinol methylase
MKKVIGCFVCAGKDIELIFNVKTHRIGRCQDCRTYVNMDFDESKVQETFGRDYYEKVQSFAFNIKRIGRHDPSYGVYLKGLGVLDEMCTNSKLSRNVLDVGAGFGSFVATALDEGWIAQGIELSEYSSRIANDTNGLPVSSNTLEDLLAFNLKFSVITLWDVIEHVSGIQVMLEQCFNLLDPGGKLLIATDNFDSLIGDFSRTFYSTLNWKWPLRRFLIPQNTVYFDVPTLEIIASRVGFKLRHIELIDYPLEKINTNLIQRAILRKLYAKGREVKRNSQFLCIFER